MTNLIFVGIALRLQHEIDPAKAEQLIDQLADPFVKRQIRAEWQRLQDASVVRIEAGRDD